MRRIALVTLFTFGATLAACGTDDDLVQDQRDGVANAAAAAQLDSARIAELKARYPRLRSEPLPEPQPSPGADPEDVPDDVLETATGDATFYARHFEGRRTASGIPFRHNQLVAAHRAYPFGTLLRVTNLRNDRSVNVRVVDRGPFGKTGRARRTVIDLSRRAAERLGYVQAGRTPVRVVVLEWGNGIAS